MCTTGSAVSEWIIPAEPPPLNTQSMPRLAGRSHRCGPIAAARGVESYATRPIGGVESRDVSSRYSFPAGVCRLGFLPLRSTARSQGFLPSRTGKFPQRIFQGKIPPLISTVLVETPKPGLSPDWTLNSYKQLWTDINRYKQSEFWDSYKQL